MTPLAQTDASNSSCEPNQNDLLLLSLLGSVGSAPPLAEYLTVRDLVQLPLVSKTVRRQLQRVEYSHAKDGHLYTVPFPGFPGILLSSSSNHSPTNNHGNSRGGLFPHQLASLAAMHRAENSCPTYGSLRGGVLADAPGLGKTITLLSLVASTAGQLPQTPSMTALVSGSLPDDNANVQAWRAFLQNPACQPDMLKLLRCFWAYQTNRELRQVLEKDVMPPVPHPNRFTTIQAFASYIKQALVPYGGSKPAERQAFRLQLLELQAGWHKSNRKLLQSPQGRRLLWERRLVPTSATLLIVPDPLLEHWFQQMSWNMDRSLFVDGVVQQGQHNANREDEGRGVVYLDGVGDMADARVPLGEVQSSTPLPQPWELSYYLVVVTTFSRCRHEWKRQQRYLKSSLGKRKGRDHDVDDDDNNDHHAVGQMSLTTQQPCSLLQMRWLRVVVDEGHELGASLDVANDATQRDNSSQKKEPPPQKTAALTRFIHKLAAERRWVLSGTPTTGDEDDKAFSAMALDQIQRLLLFLRHPEYGTLPSKDLALTPPSYNTGANNTKTKKKKQHGKVHNQRKAKALWETKVKEAFLQKREHGRVELLRVLKETMVMHRKEDIQLPPPIFRDADIEIMLPAEVQEQIRQSQQQGSAAALLSEYLRTDAFQSLVDKAQGDYILEAIASAKRELQNRGGALEDDEGRARVLSWNEQGEQNPQKDRRPIKAVVYSSNTNNLRDVTEVLYSNLDGENIAEAYDDPRYDCSSELSRFRHGRKEFRACPICGYHNDVSGTAQSRRGGAAKPHCQRTLMEVCDPDDEREGFRFLIEPERVVRCVPVGLGGNVHAHQLGGLDPTQYGSDRKIWRTGDLLEVDIRDPHPLLQQRKNNETWRGDLGADTCEQMASNDFFVGQDWYFGELPKVRAEEAEEGGPNNNIFTIRVALTKFQPCHKFHNPSRWYKGPTLADVPCETRRENVFVLSLDAGLSHGLDLSFVTHIFLLEPVDDAALLEQITSRAHRLGATGSVTVETVNPFYKLDKATEEAVELAQKQQQQQQEHQLVTDDSTSSAAASRQSKKGTKTSRDASSSLTKVICQHCYRQFDSMEAALEHEEKQCPRNPANVNVVDRWHLSSVYRELRPPPPQVALAVIMDAIDDDRKPPARQNSRAGSENTVMGSTANGLRGFCGAGTFGAGGGAMAAMPSASVGASNNGSSSTSTR